MDASWGGELTDYKSMDTCFIMEIILLIGLVESKLLWPSLQQKQNVSQQQMHVVGWNDL